MPSYPSTPGHEVLLLDTQKLWDVWQTSQKENLHEPAVQEKIVLMQANKPQDPIVLQYVDAYENGQLYVRTADGRHRLEAAKRLGISHVPVLKTPVAEQAREIFSL
jgi:ParB-like chromosome segregation protein Spo0J